MHTGISRCMNIVSVTFPLFLQLIRILSNDKKKRFCRNSRKLSGCRHLVFSEDPSRQRKKNYFIKFARFIREKSCWGVYPWKILKIETESYWEALRVNWKSIWRETGNSLSFEMASFNSLVLLVPPRQVVFFCGGCWRFPALYGRTTVLTSSGSISVNLE